MPIYNKLLGTRPIATMTSMVGVNAVLSSGGTTSSGGSTSSGTTSSGGTASGGMTSSVSILIAPPAAYVGAAFNASGVVAPTGTAVQVGLSTSATVAPTSFESAAVVGTAWSATLTPPAAGTYYVWARQTGATTVQAVSGAISVAAVPAYAVVTNTYGTRTFTINLALASAVTHASGTTEAGNFSPSIAFGSSATFTGYWTQTAPTSEPSADGVTVVAITGALAYNGNLAVYIPPPPTAGVWFLSFWVDNDSPNNGGFVTSPFIAS